METLIAIIKGLPYAKVGEDLFTCEVSKDGFKIGDKADNQVKPIYDCLYSTVEIRNIFLNEETDKISSIKAKAIKDKVAK